MNKAWQSFLKYEETIRRLVLVMLLYLFPLILATRPVLDPDIWWHLRTGQWIVEHGAIPRVDEFSSYGIGKPWVAYSWLFEILVYSLYRVFGLFGIVLYTVVFSLLIAAALHRLVRRFELNFPAEVALTASGLIAMAPLYSPRPWLFTILLFVIELDWLFLVRQKGDVRQLYFLPLLFIVWANTHIQFAYGLFVLGLFTLEPLMENFFPRSQVGRNSQSVSFFSLVLILTSCVAATLVTPYHVHLYSALLDTTQKTRYWLVHILEMQALAFRTPHDWFVLAITLGAAFSLGWTRKLRPFSLLLLATGLFLSFRSHRDVWFIVTVATLIIAEACAATPATDRFPLTKLRVASCVGALLIAFPIIGWQRDLSQSHLEAIVAENYPTAAVAAVRERGYTGPLYNDFNWGGFLIWSLRTPLVVIDNRGSVHGVEHMDQSFKTWAGGKGWDSDPDLTAAHLVIANIKEALASLLRLDPRFQLVYEDKIAVVFTRSQTQGQSAASLAPQ